MLPEDADRLREREEDRRSDEYLDEQRADRLAERAPLPDVIAFTPQTLGRRHRENVANIDRILDRCEELVEELQASVDRLLGGAQ